MGRTPDREGLRETPARVARMYEEIPPACNEDPGELFVKKFNEGHQEMVLVHDILSTPFANTILLFYGVARTSRTCPIPRGSDMRHLQARPSGRPLLRVVRRFRSA